MIWWSLVVAALAAPAGWRMDGTNASTTARPPAALTADRALFATPLPSHANASVVVVGTMICGTSEPTTVWCADAASGAMKWTRTLTWVDTVAPAEREAARARLEAGDAAATRLAVVQREYSEAQRQARASADPAAFERLSALTAELDALKRTLADTATLRTPPDRELIGYASATPATDGSNLYVLLGHGVLAKLDSAGKVVWARYLGPSLTSMNGYHLGSTASPLLAGGVLIVPYVKLQGVDPATGRELWSGATYRDYGTPAVADIDGVWVVATPAGEIVGAADGNVYARGLAAVWYCSPTFAGDWVFWVGGENDAHVNRAGAPVSTGAAVWREGGTVRAEVQWQYTLPVEDRVYATPLVYNGVLFTGTRFGTVVAQKAADGGIYYATRMPGLDGELWANPAGANNTVWFGSHRGAVYALRASTTLEVVATSKVGENYSSPVFYGNNLYLRTYKSLQGWRGL